MPRFSPRILVSIAAAVAVIAALPFVRKDPIGVYGVVERVVLEPSADKPERVQLWGVFSLSDAITVRNGVVDRVEPGAYGPPERGYLYYTINPADAARTRAEWAEIQSLAGTGAAVGFGASFPPVDPAAPPPRALDTAYAMRVIRYNGRIRRGDEPVVSPDTFPLRMKDVPTRLRADPANRVVAAVLRVK